MSTSTLWYERVEMGEQASFTQEGVVLENRSNGNGYFQYEPAKPKPVRLMAAELNDCVVPRFTEFSAVLDSVLSAGSVLLEGAPGSGKSNICQDTERCCQRLGVPLLRFAVHINAGTARYFDETLDRVSGFRQSSRQTPGVLILDNADYPGYKGSSRTRKNAFEYAEVIVPAFIKAVEDESTAAIGTSHDDDWRASKWQWRDPAIDRPAADLLEAYKSKIKFQGRMQTEAIKQLIESRGTAEETAEAVTRELGRRGILLFHYANHLDIEKFVDEPETALQEVREGRRQRYQMSRGA